MKMRSVLMIVLALLPLVTALLVFAQGEPMANPDCTTDALGEATTQIDELYTDGQTAFENGDVRTWLDSLRAISWLSSSLRAFCDGYVFEGDAEGSNSQVFGPVIFQPGIYTVTATTEGYIGVGVEEVDGECRLFLGALEGEASEGAQEIFRVEDDPCTALVQISNITEEWHVEFSLVSAED